MFSADLAVFKTKQNELQQQAELYRLVKSSQQTKPLVSRIAGVIGRLLIHSGTQLVNRTGELNWNSSQELYPSTGG